MIRSPLATLVFALCFALAANTAEAQLRTIPADAKRATMSHVHGMIVEIDGKRAELSAGAQIRDGGNLIVVPTAVPPGVLVKYRAGQDGKLSGVWILSPQEAAQPDPKK